MDFSLNDTQLQLQASARKFARAEMPSVAETCERLNEPVPDAMRLRLAELGFLGINLPPQFGGQGLGHLDALLVLEEFAQISSAAAFPLFEANVGPVQAIARFAAPQLKEQVIPEVTAGRLVIAVAMSEPEAGSALTDLRTRAEQDGDALVISGQKRWCSGAGHAGGYLVYVRFGTARGAAGIGAVYVPKDAPGVSFGAPEELMGFRGVPSADIVFDSVRVPAHHLVVEAGGFGRLMQAFDLERCGNATMALAQASGALEDVQTYVQERTQFGKPLVEFQAVQLKLAEMKMRVEAARLLIWRAVSQADAGLPAALDSALAKCFANESAREVAGQALQLMGGYGYARAHAMERRLRDAWGWGIAGGAIDIQKVNIAAGMVGRRFDQRR